MVHIEWWLDRFGRSCLMDPFRDPQVSQVCMRWGVSRGLAWISSWNIAVVDFVVLYQFCERKGWTLRPWGLWARATSLWTWGLETSMLALLHVDFNSTEKEAGLFFLPSTNQGMSHFLATTLFIPGVLEEGKRFTISDPQVSSCRETEKEEREKPISKNQ